MTNLLPFSRLYIGYSFKTIYWARPASQEALIKGQLCLLQPVLQLSWPGESLGTSSHSTCHPMRSNLLWSLLGRCGFTQMQHYSKLEEEEVALQGGHKCPSELYTLDVRGCHMTFFKVTLVLSS